MTRESDRFPVKGCGTVAREAAEVVCHRWSEESGGVMTPEELEAQGGIPLEAFVLLWNGYPPRSSDVRSPGRDGLTRLIVKTALDPAVDWRIEEVALK